MRSQRLAAKAGRPKRRAAAAKSHFVKYQLANNPSKVEESDLKRALEESLKDTQHQQQQQQQQSQTNGTTTKTFMILRQPIPSTTTTTTSTTTKLITQSKTSPATNINHINKQNTRSNINNNNQTKKSKLSPTSLTTSGTTTTKTASTSTSTPASLNSPTPTNRKIISSNNLKLVGVTLNNGVNNHHSSSYSDASRSNNSTSSSSSTSTPSSSFMINNVTCNNIVSTHDNNVRNGIVAILLPNHIKPSTTTSSTSTNTPITTKIIPKKTRSANNYLFGNDNDDIHHQHGIITNDSNNISTKTNNNHHPQLEQINKRAKLMNTVRVHKNGNNNYVINQVDIANINNKNKNETTITNGNGYTTNTCDASTSTHVACSTYPNNVVIGNINNISNKKMNNNNINKNISTSMATPTPLARPLRTYSKDKSYSNNSNNLAITNITTTNNNNGVINHISDLSSLGPNSSTPIIIKPQTSMGIDSTSINNIGKKKKKKNKKTKNNLNTIKTLSSTVGPVSRSTQTMGVTKVNQLNTVHTQNGSMEPLLQIRSPKIVYNPTGSNNNDTSRKRTSKIQESNPPYKSILKIPTPDANPPPHLNRATQSSTTVQQPYLYSKRESKNDAYAKMTALKVSNSKSPSGHTKQTSSTSVTPRPSTPLITPVKTVTISKTPPISTPSNWSLLGIPEERLIYLRDDEPIRKLICYPAIKHIEGDVIHVRDSVLLRSGAKNTDLPYIAKICAFWEDAETGSVMMSLYWYYRPEHTEEGRKKHHLSDEIFASKHRDVDSVECIEDKCYVLTFNEYCRYKKRCKMEQYNVPWSLTDLTIPVSNEPYPRRTRIPDSSVNQELIFCCRQIYDSRLRRLMKNPLISPKYGHF